jgi:hypothetical protein
VAIPGGGGLSVDVDVLPSVLHEVAWLEDASIEVCVVLRIYLISLY